MYHKTVNTILNLLKEKEVWFETFEHVPVRTSEEAANVRHGYLLSQGAKAIIARAKVKDEGKKFIMLVVPGDKRFDSEKLKMLGVRDIRFATESEVGELTEGVLPGGVPPFGNIFSLPLYADEGILKNEKIIFNAGDRSFSIAMKSEDYKNIATPIIVSII